MFNSEQNHTNSDEQQEEVVIDDISIYEQKSKDSPDTEPADSGNIQDEVSPQLFSDEVNNETSSGNDEEVIKSEDEDFEIPAFLRKQKF